MMGLQGNSVVQDFVSDEMLLTLSQTAWALRVYMTKNVLMSSYFLITEFKAKKMCQMFVAILHCMWQIHVIYVWK